MSIRTTLTIDEDVMAVLKSESRSRGVPFRKLLNDVLRRGISAMKKPAKESGFFSEPYDLGTHPGVNYDNVGELIEQAEGEDWR